MKKILIVTTVSDRSLPLFFVPNIKRDWLVDVIHYDTIVQELQAMLERESFDAIYCRDPFNAEYDLERLRAVLETLIKYSKDAYIVDGIEKLDDFMIEDKWLQYQVYKDFMPNTQLLSDGLGVERDYIVKERISSRGKGIYFDVGNVPQEDAADYIIQNKLVLEKEYRVFAVRNKILPLAGVKRSKTDNTTVKVLGVTPVPEDLIAYAQPIVDANKGDLIGLDIAKTDSGYVLIEINRSPLFNSYYRYSGVNPLERLLNSL